MPALQMSPVPPSQKPTDLARKFGFVRDVLNLQEALRVEQERNAAIVEAKDAVIAAKDSEILRLHEVIRLIERSRRDNDLFLQEMVMEKGNPEYPVPNYPVRIP